MFLAGNMSRRQVDLESHCTSFSDPRHFVGHEALAQSRGIRYHWFCIALSLYGCFSRVWCIFLIFLTEWTSCYLLQLL